MQNSDLGGLLAQPKEPSTSSLAPRNRWPVQFAVAVAVLVGVVVGASMWVGLAFGNILAAPRPEAPEPYPMQQVERLARFATTLPEVQGTVDKRVGLTEPFMDKVDGYVTFIVRDDLPRDAVEALGQTVVSWIGRNVPFERAHLHVTLRVGDNEIGLSTEGSLNSERFRLLWAGADDRRLRAVRVSWYVTSDGELRDLNNSYITVVLTRFPNSSLVDLVESWAPALSPGAEHGQLTIRTAPEARTVASGTDYFAGDEALSFVALRPPSPAVLRWVAAASADPDVLGFATSPSYATVAVPDREAAQAVSNRLRPFLDPADNVTVLFTYIDAGGKRESVHG